MRNGIPTGNLTLSRSRARIFREIYRPLNYIVTGTSNYRDIEIGAATQHSVHAHVHTYICDMRDELAVERRFWLSLYYALKIPHASSALCKLSSPS